jgi:hypothetical protein
MAKFGLAAIVLPSTRRVTLRRFPQKHLLYRDCPFNFAQGAIDPLISTPLNQHNLPVSILLNQQQFSS